MRYDLQSTWRDMLQEMQSRNRIQVQTGYKGFSVGQDLLPAMKKRYPDIPFQSDMSDGRVLRCQPWWPAAQAAIFAHFSITAFRLYSGCKGPTGCKGNCIPDYGLTPEHLLSSDEEDDSLHPALSAHQPPPPPVGVHQPPPAVVHPTAVVNLGRGGGGRGGGRGRGGKGGGRGGGATATLCRYGSDCYSFVLGDGRCPYLHPTAPLPATQQPAPVGPTPPPSPLPHAPPAQQPVLSMSMTMGQTIGDLSHPPSYLVRIGVPKDQADALLVVYPGKPLRAALAFAHQNPNGPVFFLCGSDRHSARDSPRLREDPDDTNNTCFSIFDLFEGKLDDSKTLTRVVDYLRTQPPTLGPSHPPPASS